MFGDIAIGLYVNTTKLPHNPYNNYNSKEPYKNLQNFNFNEMRKEIKNIDYYCFDNNYDADDETQTDENHYQNDNNKITVVYE
jgi:hypothetical protein